MKLDAKPPVLESPGLVLISVCNNQEHNIHDIVALYPPCTKYMNIISGDLLDLRLSCIDDIFAEVPTSL